MHIKSPSERIRSLQYTHSAAIATALSVVVIAALAWVALNISGEDEPNVLVYDAELADAPKATGQAWALGVALYWDAVGGNFTTTSAGNTLCGRAGAAALSADTTGTVIFNTFA